MKNGLKFNINSFKNSKQYKHLLNSLALVKQVNLKDLKKFLAEDHTNFSVLSVQLKYIPPTNRLSVTLSKNSARNFYLGKKKTQSESELKQERPNLKDDCLTDAQNCQFFNLFNSKEKRLWSRFHDKYESNFEGTAETRLLRFITLTFNTTDDNQYSFTTNTDINDPCWEPLIAKKPYLQGWAPKHDSTAEPKKIKLQKVITDVTQLDIANSYLAKFIREVRTKWKPPQWKYVVVRELMKNGTWHFHIITTPLVPYSHICNNSQEFASCWDCRSYLNELWPYGRVESRLMNQINAKKYIAKYISKSFHLRDLYAQHGLKESSKTYTFFKNVYDYEERIAVLKGKSKTDQLTGEHLPPNQHIFRKSDNTYFYRTKEKLIGQATNPEITQKNYRLGTHVLNPLSLLKLAKKAARKEALLLNLKNKRKTYQPDFQEFLITNLLMWCKKAEFLHTPLEQGWVPKEGGQCNNSVYQHFQIKPIFHFTFKVENTQSVKEFFHQLDDYAKEFDMEESKDFVDPRFTDPIESRNAYLNWWQITTNEYRVNQPNYYYDNQ